jgi:phospholipid-binding lipoprotein MlaA
MSGVTSSMPSATSSYAEAPGMTLLRTILPLLPSLLCAACAAVPGEELGTIEPRSPVTLAERQNVYPIDIYDPWEGFNRSVYKFNTQFDRYVFLPIVHGYEYVMPNVAEQGVSNFFNNLSEFRNGMNALLQARGDVFGTALSRFFVNSTLGIAGLFDLATDFGIAEHPEDFGQTLGWWGFSPGPYLVLPILGPSNVRDAGGTAADTAAVNVVPGVADINDTVYFNAVVYGLYAVDLRHQVGFRYYQSGSPFEYDLVRFFYTKRRELDVLK